MVTARTLLWEEEGARAAAGNAGQPPADMPLHAYRCCSAVAEHTHDTLRYA